MEINLSDDLIEALELGTILNDSTLEEEIIRRLRDSTSLMEKIDTIVEKIERLREMRLGERLSRVEHQVATCVQQQDSLVGCLEAIGKQVLER